MKLIRFMSASVLRPCIWLWYVFRLRLLFSSRIFRNSETLNYGQHYAHTIFKCRFVIWCIHITRIWFEDSYWQLASNRSCNALPNRQMMWMREIRYEYGELLRITVVLWDSSNGCIVVIWYCSIFAPSWLSSAWQTHLIFSANMINCLIYPTNGSKWK